MRKLVLAALMLTGVLVQARPAAACTCTVRSLPEQLAAATTVFTGSVRSVTPVADGSRATFDVSIVYKGDIESRTRVTTAKDSAACGIPFAREATYVVFATGQPSALATGTCNGTSDDTTIVLGLTPLRTFAPPEDDDGELPGNEPGSRSLPIGTAAGLLTLVVAGSIWAWMQRARPPRPLV